jgi:hypothetical protein
LVVNSCKSRSGLLQLGVTRGGGLRHQGLHRRLQERQALGLLADGLGAGAVLIACQQGLAIWFGSLGSLTRSSRRMMLSSAIRCGEPFVGALPLGDPLL